MSQLALAATQYVPFDSKKNLNSGDTAWVLAAAALVLLMTPGLAFFYGGMVRAKHILGMLIQNFAAIAVVSVTWILVGFSLAFGGEGKFLGDLHFFGMQNVNDVVPAMGTAQTIPTLAFVAFQVTFAIITPALVTGAAADRWKFGAFVAFVTVWSIVIYAPVAHWVFDGYGWLNRSLQPAGKFFAEDFAGGTVVHINAGAAGLAMALVLGKRRGWPREKMRGNNIPFVMLGAGLLWFGWFGFNAGSALTAGNLASYAWVNTNTATATALLGWIIVEKLRYGKSTALGAASGAVAGLVAITPCAGFVSPIGSIFIGLLAGSICAFAINLKNRFGYDDSLDVVGVHLVRRLDRHAVHRLLQHHRNQRARERRHPVRRRGQVRGVEPAAAPVHGGWSGDDLLVRRYLHHRQGDRSVLQDSGHRGRGAAGSRPRDPR